MDNNSFTLQLQKELTTGEKVLWEGRPNPFSLLTREDIFLIPFSLIWSIGIIPAVIGKNDFDFPFGLIFLAFAFYFTIGRFIYKIIKRKHTYYVLTNKRIIILNSLLGTNLQAAYINTLPAINRTTKKNGNGSIIFGNQNKQSKIYSNNGLDFFSRGNISNVLVFYDIPDVDSVYSKINGLRDTKQK